MSYFNAARKAGTYSAFVREEDDYIYDTPHLSSNDSCPAQRTSYHAIEHAVHTRGSEAAVMSHPAPDAWESRWLAIREAA